MDTLDNTKWDVLIVGTGLQQSLLALALSRSGKKILHIDKNDYYGGAEAAFSLQEAERWAKSLNEDAPAGAFSNVSVSRPEPTASENSPSLASSRAYSLELSPQILYARSSLLQYLVSSGVHKQLEFLPVGTWWVYSRNPDQEPSNQGTLLKVPSGREDVFQDQVLDFKAKRALMKFLRFIADYEEQTDVWQNHRDQPFPAFLTEQFKVPGSLHAPLVALTLSSASSGQTTTEFALPRIARHLRSIGVFGPGFGAVIPKWGGMSEIVQVACRSCAVGGGVYVLGKGLPDTGDGEADSKATEGITLRLKDGESVTTRWLVEEDTDVSAHATSCKSITIVSSPLLPLLPPLADEAPPPASSVVVFPSGSLTLGSGHGTDGELPPVHILVHSSDTGECPAGQSLLYASTSLQGEGGSLLLGKAVSELLSTVDVTPPPKILWSVKYEHGSSPVTGQTPGTSHEHTLKFPGSSLDPAFDDTTLDRVKEIWRRIVGDDAPEFLVFEDREAVLDDDEQ